MCSPLKGFLLIVSLKAITDKWRIRFCFRCVQLIFAVCCTPWRSSPRCVAHCWDCLCGVYRDHLQGVMHTEEIISAVCCTLQILSPPYVAHRRDDLCGMLHTAEIISTVGCTQRRSLCDWMSRRNENLIRKYFRLFIRGPDGFESWKK